MKVPRITAVEISEEGLFVAFDLASNPEFYSWRWLQDHSQDSSRYDNNTKQRKVDTFAIDPSVRGLQAAVVGDHVEVTWSDHSEPGQFPVRLLAEVAGLVDCQPSSFTDRPIPLAYDEVISSDPGLSAWLSDVARFGFGIVHDVPTSGDGAETLVRRVGYPRQTIFGDMWNLSSELTDHSDSAYSQSFLEPHTDGTYSHDAPGLQMFCCLEREGEGGESILVDGFAIAEQLRQTDQSSFDVLTKVEVKSHYVEPGIHLSAQRPLIRLNKAGGVEQISFNNYDRAPFRLPPGEEENFYAAYSKFHSLLNDRDSWTVLRLNPGDALLFDNWRMLHGRMEYVGKRVFIGCYHNREDFESRRRVLEQTTYATPA
ncbi:MAG: TauD/TfdA family dioxygenase [Ilumatobacteraceae bacterium]